MRITGIEASGADVLVNGERVPFVTEVSFGDDVVLRNPSRDAVSCSVMITGEMPLGICDILPPRGKIYSGNARDRRRQKRADRKSARTQAAQGTIMFKRWSNGALRPA